MKFSSIPVLLAMVGVWVHAQTADRHLMLDVASIKPAAPPTMGPGGSG